MDLFSRETIGEMLETVWAKRLGLMEPSTLVNIKQIYPTVKERELWPTADAMKVPGRTASLMDKVKGHSLMERTMKASLKMASMMVRVSFTIQTTFLSRKKASGLSPS